MTTHVYIEVVVESVTMTGDESTARGTVKIGQKETVHWNANLVTGFVRFEGELRKQHLGSQIKKAVLGIIGQVNLPLTRTTTVEED